MKRKILLVLLITFISLYSTGQINKDDIIGSWVATRITYNSGQKLPIEHPLNNHYLRYDFINKEKVFKTSFPLESGHVFDFKILNNQMKIGFVKYKILFLSTESLILIEEGMSGFDGSAIKYHFIPEEKYQESLPLTSDMVIKTQNDTIFIENKKIKAKFEYEQGFHDFIRKRIPEYSNVVSSDNFFLATFIVNSRGKIDSLTIQRGINKKFDKQFIKAVKKSAKHWQPAKFNGKAVSVLHTETFKFVSHPKFETQYLSYQNGLNSMHQKDYQTAIKYFSQCISSNPEDYDSQYKRGVCYYKLGIIEKACEDFLIAQKSKKIELEDYLKKTCDESKAVPNNGL